MITATAFEVGRAATEKYLNEGLESAHRFSDSFDDIDLRCIATIAITAAQTAVMRETDRRRAELDAKIARLVELPQEAC